MSRWDRPPFLVKPFILRKDEEGDEVLIDGTQRDCFECNGEGEHECSCGDSHECMECNGSGKITGGEVETVNVVEPSFFATGGMVRLDLPAIGRDDELIWAIVDNVFSRFKNGGLDRYDRALFFESEASAHHALRAINELGVDQAQALFRRKRAA